MKFVAAVLAGGLIASPAGAATDAGALLKAIADCRALPQPEARLACFDSATAGLQKAVDRKDVVVVDREDVQKTRKSLFGFTIPRIGLFGGGDSSDDELKEIDGVVASVRSVSYGREEVQLEGGAVWMNIESFRTDPRVGAKVHLIKASLGSYFMRVAGMRGTRCVRVR